MFNRFVIVVLCLFAGVTALSCDSGPEQQPDQTPSSDGQVAVTPADGTKTEEIIIKTYEQPIYYEKADTYAIGSSIVSKYVFTNGLKLLVLDDKTRAGKTSLYMAYDAGTRHEDAATVGLAHLTEHALYIGTSSVKPGQHDQIVKAFEKAEPNAYTRDDYVLVYDFNLPSNEIETVLKLEADRMRNVVFDADAFEFEKSRLIEEEERGQPAASLLQSELASIAFQAHPYRYGVNLTSGMKSNAEVLTLEESRRFYNECYQPDKCVMVVVGDIEIDKVLAAVNAQFGAIPRGPHTVPSRVVEPRQNGEIRKVIAVPEKKNYLLMAYHVPAYDNPDIYALMVLSAMFPSSEQGYVSCDMTRDPGLFSFFSTFPVNMQMKDVGNEMVAMVERFKVAVTEDELLVAKASVSERFAGLPAVGPPQHYRPYFTIAPDLAVYELFGSAKFVETFSDKVNAVTKEDVMRVAGQYLTKENRTVLFGKGDPTIKLKGKIGIQLATDPNQVAGVKGALIDKIFPGTPADGLLLPGDIITGIDGVEITDLQGLKMILGTKYEGDKIKVVIRRGDESLDVEVTLFPMEQ